jgi:hypothetical protein
MVVPVWIGNQGDVVKGGRSAEALVWAALAMVGEENGKWLWGDILWISASRGI